MIESPLGYVVGPIRCADGVFFVFARAAAGWGQDLDKPHGTRETSVSEVPMKTSLIRCLILLPLICLSVPAHASWWPWGSKEPVCPADYNPARVLKAEDDAVPRDLFMDWVHRLGTLSPDQMKLLNDQVLNDTACLPLPEDTRGRIPAIDKDLAVRLVDSIKRHPIVAEIETLRYNKHPGTEIGFCFGRATYTHLMLLHLGVLKDSIKKVWVVGNLQAGNLTWQFHVGTIVRSTTPGQWWVLDSYFNEPLELAEWVDRMGRQDAKGQMMLTVSSPEKFSMQIGSYDRVQLGLDLKAEEDWYAGYFSDLMKWFAGRPDVTKLGLPSPEDLR